MSNLSAKLASALVLGAVAGGASTVLPPSTAHAADNCLLEPKTDTPSQGKHWHYRTERGTGRKCWYLRGEDEKSADAPSAVPEEKPVADRADASRSIADAHAELQPRTRQPADTSAPQTATSARAAPQAAPSVWPSPSAAAPSANSGTATAPTADASPLASRWQGSDAAHADAAPAPAASPQPEATLMVADATDPDAATAQDPNAQATTPAAPAPAPAERNTGSIQKLLLVAGGALALAGLTGSAVYRLGRRRKRNAWLRERTSFPSMEHGQEPPWVEPQLGHAQSLPDLDEARHAVAHAEVSHALEADASTDRVEKIEDFLARLTEQLHAELESMPPRAERDARAAS